MVQSINLIINDNPCHVLIGSLLIINTIIKHFPRLPMMTDIGINNITIDEAKLSSFRGAAGGEGWQNTFIKN